MRHINTRHIKYCLSHVYIYMRHTCTKIHRRKHTRVCTYRCMCHWFNLSCTSGTGWRRLMGCLKAWSFCSSISKSRVIFRQRVTNDGSLLQKMTCNDEASYDSTPPCTFLAHVMCMHVYQKQIYIFANILSCAHAVGLEVYIQM